MRQTNTEISSSGCPSVNYGIIQCTSPVFETLVKPKLNELLFAIYCHLVSSVTTSVTTFYRNFLRPPHPPPPHVNNCMPSKYHICVLSPELVSSSKVEYHSTYCITAIWKPPYCMSSISSRSLQVQAAAPRRARANMCKHLAVAGGPCQSED